MIVIALQRCNPDEFEYGDCFRLSTGIMDLTQVPTLRQGFRLQHHMQEHTPPSCYIDPTISLQSHKTNLRSLSILLFCYRQEVLHTTVVANVVSISEPHMIVRRA